MARNLVHYLEIEVENIVNIDDLEKVPANVQVSRFNNIKNLNFFYNCHASRAQGLIYCNFLYISDRCK